MSSARPRDGARKAGRGGGDQTEAALTENKQGRHCWPQEILNKNHKRILQLERPQQLRHKLTN